MQFTLRLFRTAFEQLIRRGDVPPLPASLPQEFSRAENGVYVAAFERAGRKPRGRVGSYLPTKATLAEELQSQAQALRDTFPFRKEDLPYLTYEVALTSSPHFLPSLAELPADQGLLVKTPNGRQGVSLPGATPRAPEERLKEACARGQIEAAEPTRLYTFRVDIFREES